MSHFSRIFSLVAIINTTFKKLCNQTTSPMIFNSSQSDSLRHVTLCYELSRKVAVDLLAAPASQAFVERLFSVCGMLSHGRRNRLEKPLEMRVMFCTRLNKGRQH